MRKQLRLKDIGEFRGGLTYSPEDVCESHEGTLVLRSSNIQDNRISLEDNVYVKCELQDEMYVRNGDLLICSRNGSANLVGKTALIEDDLHATWGAFMMIFRTSNDPRYAYYLFNDSLSKNKGMFATSTINQLTNSMLGNIYVEFEVDLDEQKKIATYLDEKIADINSYIEARAKELELLKLFKQSKITETVTHGLRADATTKSSPLGEIPAHWEIRRTKDVCSAIFTGATPSTSIEEYWDGDIPWLPSGCCHDCYVTEAPKYITQAGLENSSTRWIPKGTTVMAITGATCAQLGSLKIDACANQSVVAFIEEKEKLDARFLFYELRALREEILTNRTGGAQAGIDTGDCMHIMIALPPLSEQQEIARYLDRECGQIEHKCALIEQQIEKLQLLKRALINEVITGKRQLA